MLSLFFTLNPGNLNWVRPDGDPFFSPFSLLPGFSESSFSKVVRFFQGGFLVVL